MADQGKDNDVELRWLTTWGQNALNVFVPRAEFLQGKSWAVEPVFENSGRWWKAEVVERILSENPEAHVIWIDDDAMEDGVSKGTEELVDSGRLTVIVPNPNLGVTFAEMDFIERMVSNPVAGIRENG